MSLRIVTPQGQLKNAVDSTTGWATYTPEFETSAADGDVGDGTITGRYYQIGTGAGATVWSRGSFSPGIGSLGTGNFFFSIPFSMDYDASQHGVGYAYDASAARVVLCMVRPGASSTRPHKMVELLYTGTTNFQVAATTPFTMANGDEYHWTLMYQRAA